MSNKVKWIYVCSPYSGEDKEYNIKVAQAVCRSIVKAGNLPIAPHLYFPQFLNDDIPEERTDGLKIATYLLDMADELWVVGETFSKGMKDEITYASRNEIPITFIPAPEIKEEASIESIVSHNPVYNSPFETLSEDAYKNLKWEF